MPDTITSRGGLTKPEVGASEDTWGNKMNANFDKVDGGVPWLGAVNVFTADNTFKTPVVIDRPSGATRSVMTFMFDGVPRNILQLRSDGALTVTPAGGSPSVLFVGNDAVWTSSTSPTMINNAIGSPGFMKNMTGSPISPGQTVSGSNLRYSNTAGFEGQSATGTWFAQGHAAATSQAGSVTLFTKVF